MNVLTEIETEKALQNKMSDRPITKMLGKDVSVYYSEKRALYDVNLNIKKNTVTALIGPSGCGKSTFLRTLNRMNDTIDGCRVTGKITLDDQDIYAPTIDVVELRVQGPAGKIEGASLRLFDPQSGEWSMHYADARDGALARPVHGGFHDGRGEFFGEEDLDGRHVLVHFVITRAGADSARFEQAYSQDGGRSWETNWIAVDTRIGP